VNEIDLLRFCAAMAVVFHHYAFRGYAADAMSVMPYPWLAPAAKYGYLGVELFFMISGFVILMTASSGSLKGFLISRFVRLYPAFWACCTITFIVTLAIGAPRFVASWSQYLVNMTMTSGFFGVPDMDGSYWSLFVEMKFYGMVAVVLLLRRIRYAEPLLVLWLVASVAQEFVSLGRLRSWLILDYSAFFIAGAACFLVWSEGLTTTRVGMIAGSWALSVWQSLKALPGVEKHYSTTTNGYLVAGMVTAFFAVMFLVSTRRTGAIGRYRWTAVGAMTYPLYLLHQHIGFAVFNRAYPAINPHVLLWTIVAVMLVLSYAIHATVERRWSPKLKDVLVRAVDSLDKLTKRSVPQVAVTSGSSR